jgi:hypothetical protein
MHWQAKQSIQIMRRQDGEIFFARLIALISPAPKLGVKCFYSCSEQSAR